MVKILTTQTFNKRVPTSFGWIFNVGIIIHINHRRVVNLIFCSNCDTWFFKGNLNKFSWLYLLAVIRYTLEMGIFMIFQEQEKAFNWFRTDFCSCLQLILIETMKTVKFLMTVSELKWKRPFFHTYLQLKVLYDCFLPFPQPQMLGLYPNLPDEIICGFFSTVEAICFHVKILIFPTFNKDDSHKSSGLGK